MTKLNLNKNITAKCSRKIDIDTYERYDATRNMVGERIR